MKRLSLVAAACAGLGLLCIAILGVADIIGTQFLRRPVPGTVELTRGLMVFSIMLGIAHAESERKHIRVELGVNALPPHVRRFLDVLAPVSMALLFAAVAWGGWDMLRQSIANSEYDEGLMKLPLWPARLALAFGATLMTLQSLTNAAETFRRPVLRSPEQPLAPL